MAEMRAAVGGADDGRGGAGGAATDGPGAGAGRGKLDAHKFGGLMAKLDGQLGADGAAASPRATKARKALIPVEPRSNALKEILAKMEAQESLDE